MSGVQIITDYIRNDNNRKGVVEDLHNIGIDYLTPCTDAGFKHVLNDDDRSKHFISFFCNVLDKNQDSACRMLDGNKILENRSVAEIKKIPESIDFKGAVELKKNNGSKKVTSRAASQKKIDSGFVVSTSPSGTTSTAQSGETDLNEKKFKISTEVQVDDEKNAQSRWVDYGIRVFLYRGENNDNVGSNCKTYEIALCRWSIKNAPMKLVSISGQKGCDCDKDVSGDLVDKTCLCCISFFLGQSVQILEKITQYFQKKLKSGEVKENDEDKKRVKSMVKKAMEAERKTLSQQVFSLMHPGKTKNKIENINYDSQELEQFDKTVVDWLGFFKYGHLMSEEDVRNLTDANLKQNYESMKITKDNVMENIDQINKIWGSVPFFNQKALNEAKARADKAEACNKILLKAVSESHDHQMKEELRGKGFDIPYSPNSAPGSAKKQLSGNELKARQSKKAEGPNSNKQPNVPGTPKSKGRDSSETE